MKRPLPTQSDESKDERRFDFFLAASHQLKSPVAIIKWCLESALDRGELSVKDKELVRKANIQAGSMGTLITDMLQVLRLENSDRQNGFERVMLAALIVEIQSQYESFARERGVSLIVRPSRSHHSAMADPTYLKQAIINLVDNAIKYSKPMGTVEIGVDEIDGMTRIFVHDEGIGINQAEQLMLFREFFRGQEAKTVAYEGTGLGLVLVKHIAESFYGRVEVSSQLGLGSTFALLLPKT